MPEGVGRVEHIRATAEALRVEQAEEKIPHQGFPRWHQLVGEDVPGTNLQPSGADEDVDALGLLRPYPEVILQQHRLAVEQEAAEGGLPLEPVDQVIERGDQAGEKRRSREIPFPVPVRVGNEVEGVARPRADRNGGVRHS